jgi:osmotically-inducible protein OsmY
VVDSYAKKTEAEDAAKNVAGVTALVEKIEVKYPSTYSKTNAEIATGSINRFEGALGRSQGQGKGKGEDGWITLTGDLGWNYQKEAAKTRLKA